MSALERVGELGRRGEYSADCGGEPAVVVGRWSLVGCEPMGLTNDA